MDLNFHLLTSSQIKKIQDICLASGFSRKSAGSFFRDTREQTNVIIEEAGPDNNCPDYKTIAGERIEEIRDAFWEEKKRRKEESERRVGTEESFEDWPGRDGYREWRPYSQTTNFADDIEHWPKEVEEHVFADYDDPEEYGRLIDEYSDALLNLVAPSSEDYCLGFESYLTATNADLKIMALELFRLKYELLHAKYEASAASGTATLGSHFRYTDTKRKSDIFLFIGNITNEAMAIDRGLYPCTADDLLEITFIHEMFHAYYANYSKNDLIFLRCFHDIEEAMAEMGTIWFCSKYDGGRLFQLADKVVYDKWACRNPSLACYGLGSILYNQWGSDVERMIGDYQLIQRLFRYGNPDVAAFCRDLSAWNWVSCKNGLERLFGRILLIKKNPSQHFYYLGKTTGERLTLVEDYLNYLSDCGGRAPKLLYVKGKYQEVFKDETLVTKAEQRNFDMYRIINPFPGKNYEPWRVWNLGLDGNTIAFIDEIIRYCHRGWARERITII